jgi:hypothetical protein
MGMPLLEKTFSSIFNGFSHEVIARDNIERMEAKKTVSFSLFMVARFEVKIRSF